MIINKENIKSAIQTLEIQNKCVCIHSSFKSFGYHVNGGASTVINAFLDMECTVMVLTCADIYEVYPPTNLRPARNGAGDYSYLKDKKFNTPKIFTVDSNDITKEDMGLIPYTLVNMSSRKRGYNPLNSFAAVGMEADELVHNQSNINVFAPLQKLFDFGGCVLLMGVNLDRATIIHYAEQIAGRTPFVRWANNFNGDADICNVGGCSGGFENFSGKLKSVEKNIIVGNSLWRCFPAKEIVDICSNAMIETPEISHCENANCERCNDAILGGPIW